MKHRLRRRKMYLARTISLRDFYLFYNWWLGRQSKLTGRQLETEKNRNEHRTKIHTAMIKREKTKKKKCERYG